jgi:propanol-preferring alcohol dehydrogenase
MTKSMRAMVMHAPGQPLREERVPQPMAGVGQILVRVRACGVCRTDLQILDGDLTKPKLPLILGHEIAGQVEAVGLGSTRFKPGDRVGVAWLGWTCGKCRFCLSGRENLCDQARFTGYNIDGGYAEYTVADERFCFALPKEFTDVSTAPLLCAGSIGYRSLRKAGDPRNIGI